MIAGRRYHYSALWGFSFWVIAFLGPSHAMKEFICKLFIKALRNSLKFLEIRALLSIWYCYLHNFFPCSFHIILIVEKLMVEVNSFDVRRSYLIIFLFLLNHEELCWLEIWDFHIEILFVQLILVIHRFFASCRNDFLTIYIHNKLKIVSSRLYEVKQQIGSAATLTMCVIKGNF